MTRENKNTANRQGGPENPFFHIISAFDNIRGYQKFPFSGSPCTAGLKKRFNNCKNYQNIK